MKLKTRLSIAFCIIIFVPVMLAGLALCGFQHIQLKEIEQNYGIECTDYNYLINSVQLLSSVTRDISESLKTEVAEDPEKMEDMQYLDEINTQLSENFSYLIVRKDDKITYIGAEDSSSIPDDLPKYGTEKMNPDMRYYIDGEAQNLVKQIDFMYEDGSQGSMFIITAMKKIVPELKELLIDMIVSIILILIFTAAMLGVWIYRGFINPIRQLKDATQKIKEGNLNFTLDAESDDEVGELCRNFEEMRQRLKDSAEEKLASEKENRALISNIAHDLKTPITAVKGYSEGIIDGVADTPEKKEKYIRTIYNKANEMDLLLNELTLYSRIDTNRIPYNFNKINVMEYFDDCIEEIGLDLEAKDIGLSYFNYADDGIQIIADPEQLKRVINNIIGNSIKYLDKPKGFINIRIKDVGDFIQVEIEDNGKGIAAKDLPYIFDRFYRTDTSRNSSTGGSGIGLSIVQKIVEDHGGKIWATSKETTGTIMYFVLRKYQEVPNE